MKKKVVWLVVSCLMVAALLLASCAPAVVEEEEEKVAPPVKEGEVVVPEKEVVVPKAGADMVKWTGTKLDGTVVEKMIEKPRYGGVYVISRETQPGWFDGNLGPAGSTWVLNPTSDEMLTPDWTRGPEGTGEIPGYTPEYLRVDFATGMLAESWEHPDSSTLVFHVRKGVKWTLDPTSEASRLVGGREFTAADVVWNLIREYKTGYYSYSYPDLADMKNPENSIYVSPTDPWTVIMKSREGQAGAMYGITDYHYMMPPEVIAKYGNMNNWKNVVGVGPFILTNYVGASSLTYVRNPDYWMRDPFFPENQLPYLDGVKILIIPDLSTRLAALRTGKIDNLYDLKWDDAESLLKTNPELGLYQYRIGSRGISMRVDKPELPFYDVRVRRALNMAVNKQAIAEEYYSGKADIFTYPIAPFPEYMDAYVPLEQMPESVKELYTYNPDKARQLLAEAGYPNGFTTEVLLWSQETTDVYSIVAADLAKIGVTLKLDIRENTIFTSMRSRKTYTQMAEGAVSGSMPFKVHYERSGALMNYSMIVDPRSDALFDADKADFFDWAKRAELAKASTVWRNEMAWYIYLPAPWSYMLWHPWLGSVNGLVNWGYTGVQGGYTRFIWIKQDVKKAMGR